MSQFPGPATGCDRKLIDRLSRCEPDGLDELFRKYRGVAFRVAYRLLGNEADALDAVQDGFVKVVRHIGRFRGGSSLKTWVLRVVSNAALDLGRQRRRRIARTNDWFHHRPDEFAPADRMSDVEREDVRGLVAAAVASLPEAQRQTFVLHVEGGLSYRDVAETLGVPIGTVMSRLYFARKKLQALLADRVTA